MVKSLIEALAPKRNLGANQKWKSWNIIAIQADFGESRISAGAAEPESNPSTQVSWN
jgi:hypothetical protein